MSYVNTKELKATTIPNPVVTGGIKEIGLEKIAPIDIPRYLFMHPALPRGIEIKSNRMVTRVDNDLFSNIRLNEINDDQLSNLNIPEDSKLKNKDYLDKLRKEAGVYCKEILDNSGGPLYIKKMATGAYRFGTSFSVLQQNVAETKVLKFEYQHEIFFGPSVYPLDPKDPLWGNVPMADRVLLKGKMKINFKTKDIDKYTQLTKRYPTLSESNLISGVDAVFVNTMTHPEMKKSSSGPLVPIGDEFDSSEVIKLAFDTLGDEPLGIPLVQFVHLTIKYLLDMEKAGAQTMVNFGFNKWKAMTPFKDEKKMKLFGKSLANLQKDSVVILPEGITLENIEPGQTEFNKIHPIYMQLIAIRLGIPAPLLEQDGTTTNKSTLDSQKEDMYEDFRADELVVEKVISEGFFKSCKIKWKKLTHAEICAITPKFVFKRPPENLDKEMDRELKFSLMVRNYSTAAKDWAETGGVPEVLEQLGNKLNLLLTKSIASDKRLLAEMQVMGSDIPKTDPKTILPPTVKNKSKDEVEEEPDGGK